jgi:hypothetical protein
MGEHNVFGYFQTMERAQQAAEELKRQGFEVSVDRFAPFLGGKPFDGDQEIHSILAHQGNSLATTSLGTPERLLDDDTRVLAAAHEDASGLAGGTGFVHPEDVCVTVFANGENYDQATQILESFGARK